MENATSLKNKVETNLFSIIIPVYNTSKYISQCLESVANQSYKDYEVILINDGSTDNSEEILIEFCNRFSNFNLITKRNEGVSATRNLGIDKSKGQYLIFLDSDDYWSDKDVLKQLADLIEQSNYPDLILHEETRLFPTGDILYENNIEFVKTSCTFDFKKDLKKLIYNELFVASPWDKIVKREIIANHSLYFPVGLKSEDMIWSADLIPYIMNYVFFEKSFYVYRQLVKGSATNTVSEKHLNNIWQMLETSMLNSKINSDINQSYWAEHYAFLLMNFEHVLPENKSVFYSKLKENVFFLKKGATKNVDKVAFFYNIFGLRTTIYLLNFFRKINALNKRYRIIK